MAKFIWGKNGTYPMCHENEVHKVCKEYSVLQRWNFTSLYERRSNNMLQKDKKISRMTSGNYSILYATHSPSHLLPICIWSNIANNIQSFSNPFPSSSMHVKSFQLCPTLWTLWTVASQAPVSMRFSRQEYWSGLPFPTTGDLPNPGIKLASFLSPALVGRFFITSASWQALLSLEGRSIDDL